jgi:hypothetical protein
MAQGKIEPLIAAAEQRAEAKSAADIHALINAIDEEINHLEAQLELKLEQITKRVEQLEAGCTPEVSA